LTDQLHDLQLEQSTLSQQKQLARQTVRTLDRKNTDLQNSLDSITVDKDELSLNKTTIQEIEASLAACQDEYTQKSYDTQISNLEIQISRVDEDIKTIQTELTSTSAQSEFRVKIDVLKTDHAKKTQVQKTLIATHAERFKSLVGTDLTPTTVDSQINVLLRRKTEDLEDAERFSEGLAREITQWDAKQITCKEQLRDKRKEKNEAYSKVMAQVEDKVEDFPREVQLWEDEVVKIREYFFPWLLI
jgi:hypothetical protein